MTAASYRHLLISYSIELGCVTFNVDYRLGPATKAPGGYYDIVKVLKHVIENASELNVDPACIVLCGESGGAGTVLGAA